MNLQEVKVNEQTAPGNGPGSQAGPGPSCCFPPTGRLRPLTEAASPWLRNRRSGRDPPIRWRGSLGGAQARPMAAPRPAPSCAESTGGERPLRGSGARFPQELRLRHPSDSRAGAHRPRQARPACCLPRRAGRAQGISSGRRGHRRPGVRLGHPPFPSRTRREEACGGVRRHGEAWGRPALTGSQRRIQVFLRLLSGVLQTLLCFVNRHPSMPSH